MILVKSHKFRLFYVCLHSRVIVLFFHFNYQSKIFHLLFCLIITRHFHWSVNWSCDLVCHVRRCVNAKQCLHDALQYSLIWIFWITSLFPYKNWETTLLQHYSGVHSHSGRPSLPHCLPHPNSHRTHFTHFSAVWRRNWTAFKPTRHYFGNQPDPPRFKHQWLHDPTCCGWCCNNSQQTSWCSQQGAC